MLRERESQSKKKKRLHPKAINSNNPSIPPPSPTTTQPWNHAIKYPLATISDPGHHLRLMEETLPDDNSRLRTNLSHSPLSFLLLYYIYIIIHTSLLILSPGNRKRRSRRRDGHDRGKRRRPKTRRRPGERYH